MRRLAYAALMIALLSNLEAQTSTMSGTVSRLRESLNHMQEMNAGDTKTSLNSLRKVDQDLITAALLKEIRSDDGSSDQELISEIASMRFGQIDLNGDGQPEIVVQGSGDFCSPTGNCSFWVFMKSGGAMKLILRKGAVQTFAPEGSVHNGFRDLVLGMHGSATEQELFVYRFESGKYRRAGCFDANWTRLVNDEVQDLKDPDIQPCGKQ